MPETVTKLREIYGALDDTQLAEIAQLVESDFRILGMAVAEKSFKEDEYYALPFKGGRALVSSQSPRDIIFSKLTASGKLEMISSITLTDEQIRQGHLDLEKLQGKKLEEVISRIDKKLPEFAETAHKTIHTVFGAKDGNPSW